MRECRLFRDPVCGESRELCGDGRPDIGAEYQRDGCVEVDESAGAECENDSGCRGTALDDHGHDESDSYGAEEREDGHMAARRRRAVERAEEGQERGKLADQLEFGAHNAHAEEKEPEPEDGFSPAAQIFPCDEHHQKSEDDRRHDDAGYVECDDLRGNGRSDVCPEDDADRLHQIQEPRVDEADHHDGGCAGGLDDRSDECPRDDRHITVAGEKVEDAAHAFSGGFVETVTHEFHAEYEDGESAEYIHEQSVNIDAEFRHIDSADRAVVLSGADFDVEIVFARCFSELDFCPRHTVFICENRSFRE